RFSLAGSGLSIEEAFAACVAEGVERLSPIERPGDATAAADHVSILPQAQAPIEDLLGRSNRPADTPIEWVRGRSLATGKDVVVPADWCLRRNAPGPLRDPAAALSTGVAAGPTFAAAAARALLELVERDAASLWWIGGLRAKPVAADGPAIAEAVRVFAALRQENRGRASWLLDISGDLEIPCLAAVSVDGEGRGFACGLAARLTLAEAARAAMMEMCQMELALLLADLKRQEHGDGGLGETDRLHLRRAAEITAESCASIHPFGVPQNGPDLSPAGSEQDLTAIGAVLARFGIEAALVDLTRPEFGIPVVRAVAPALQLMPSGVETSRLRKTVQSTGGGARWTNGIKLL
ncbi:MAG: YcaO-like family protein, partial [Hyphomicrobiaceae bacterium]